MISKGLTFALENTRAMAVREWLPGRPSLGVLYSLKEFYIVLLLDEFFPVVPFASSDCLFPLVRHFRGCFFGFDFVGQSAIQGLGVSQLCFQCRYFACPPLAGYHVWLVPRDGLVCGDSDLCH